MWELDYKESWALKNWCSWAVVLTRTLESPLNWKELKRVNPKGNQSWIFIGRTDAEVEAPILWSPYARADSLERPWCWERLKAGEEWKTEDEMFGQHHWLNGHESEQAPGVGDGQGSLVFCSPCGHKESEITKQLNWTELKFWCHPIWRLCFSWKQENDSYHLW